MSKVVLRRASEEAVEDSFKVISTVDSRGRKIVLRKPSILAQYRLVDLVGGDTAKNEVYMGMILPIIWVAQIEGDSITLPRTRLELDALIERIDEDGLTAIARRLTEMAESVGETADTAALKNE